MPVGKSTARINAHNVTDNNGLRKILTITVYLRRIGEVFPYQYIARMV